MPISAFFFAPSRGHFTLAAAFLLGWGRVGATEIPPAERTALLSDIREIRSLPPKTAGEGLPVVVRGIVTHLTPFELYLQNGSEAIFVWPEVETPRLQVGDFIEVTGRTHSGHLFPIVRSSRIRWLEHRGLPEPQILHYSDLATGRGDCQWVEVSGLVRAVQTRPDGTLSLRLLYDGALLRAEVSAAELPPGTQLLGARLRLRGVASGVKSPQRKLIEPVLTVSGKAETFWVETPGPADIFSVPLRSSDTLGGPEGDAPSREMVRIAGVVTCQPNPQLVYVRDQAQSLEIWLAAPAVLNVGDRIDAVGFVEMGIIQPVLRDACARRISAVESPPPRRLPDAAQLLDLRNEAELVEVTGGLRDISTVRGGYVMLIADQGMAFNVEIDASLIPSAAVLPPVGSRLALVGISKIERVTPPDLNQVVAPASVRLTLRSFDELRVLSRPSWWTPQRLLIAVAVLSAFVLGAVGWIWTLNRRVQGQTLIILDHARQQATLEERNRIAREFHDTVEQQLAGATIMLDAIDTVVLDQPQRARESLHTARAMLRHSLDEAQQAVANLRNNDLFEREFGPLVENAVRERLASSGLRTEFRHEGAWPNLDSMVKQHLLRIVQESVTNVVKHARANQVTVTMHAGSTHIGLQVADDGCGFDPQERPQRGSGEFGLIGLQERAEKIGACLTIHSAPQVGTTITVTLNPAALLPVL